MPSLTPGQFEIVFFILCALAMSNDALATSKADGPGKPLEIGSRKQLFVDDLVVADQAGVTRELGQVVKANGGKPVMVPDKPWEDNAFGCPATVIQCSPSVDSAYAIETSPQGRYHIRNFFPSCYEYTRWVSKEWKPKATTLTVLGRKAAVYDYFANSYGQYSHKTGYHALYGDGSARWFRDRREGIIRRNIDMPGGLPDAVIVIAAFNEQQSLPPQW